MILISKENAAAIAKAKKTHPDSWRDSHVTPAKHMIIVTPDEELWLDDVRIQFRDRYSITRFPDAELALDYILSKDAALLLTDDILSDGMSGTELISRLKNSGRRVRSVLLIEKAPRKATGADVLLRKPFSPAELCAAIERAVRKKT
jgi:CheY-like chemotaxis protein